MSLANTKFFIITGDPGVGKTTLTQKLISILCENGVKLSGFYTEEVRHNRIREGFDVVTLDGQRGRLARDSAQLSVPVKFKVGKYGVLIEEFENVALPTMKQPVDPRTSLIVIDEIGKMEIFSNMFKSRIKDIFSPSSKSIVLATIPSRRGDALIESIRNNSFSKVFMVTRENRNTIHEEIIKEMKICVSGTQEVKGAREGTYLNVTKGKKGVTELRSITGWEENDIFFKLKW